MAIWEKEVLARIVETPSKRILGVTTHFSEIIKLQLEENATPCDVFLLKLLRIIIDPSAESDRLSMSLQSGFALNHGQLSNLFMMAELPIINSVNKKKYTTVMKTSGVDPIGSRRLVTFCGLFVHLHTT